MVQLINIHCTFMGNEFQMCHQDDITASDTQYVVLLCMQPLLNWSGVRPLILYYNQVFSDKKNVISNKFGNIKTTTVRSINLCFW